MLKVLVFRLFLGKSLTFHMKKKMLQANFVMILKRTNSFCYSIAQRPSVCDKLQTRKTDHTKGTEQQFRAALKQNLIRAYVCGRNSDG